MCAAKLKDRTLGFLVYFVISPNSTVAIFLEYVPLCPVDDM